MTHQNSAIFIAIVLIFAGNSPRPRRSWPISAAPTVCLRVRYHGFSCRIGRVVGEAVDDQQRRGIGQVCCAQAPDRVNVFARLAPARMCCAQTQQSSEGGKAQRCGDENRRSAHEVEQQSE
jgi:hypothetical protein